MSATTCTIAFDKTGEQPRAGQKKGALGILAIAQDWQLEVDLETQLRVPQLISRTTLRPNILLVSESTKNIIIMELTVPWEDRLEEAHERKRTKYEHLVISCCMSIKLLLYWVGIIGGVRSRAIKNITEADEKA